MSYKEAAAKPKPDTSSIEKKIHAWEAAKTNATNEYVHCPDWLRKLCYAMPKIADELLAWLIQSTAYISQSDQVILTHRSESWANLVQRFLYPHIQPAELFKALRDVLEPAPAAKLL